MIRRPPRSTLFPSTTLSRSTVGTGAELPVLRAKEGDAPVKPYRNRPKTPRLGEMCPRRGGRASGVACAIVVRQGQGDHLSFGKANQRVRDAVFWLSMRFCRLFGGTKGDDEAHTYDATLGRGGAAQGTAGADVFGRAIAIVRRRVLQQGAR